MTGLLSAFLAEVVIVTYRAYSKSGVAGGGIPVPAAAPINLPLPAYYTAPIIAYGALALVPASGQQFASMVGWGLVVATLLKLWDPSNPWSVANSPQPSKPAGAPDLTRTQAPTFMGPLPA